jgi:hypothetical protein
MQAKSVRETKHSRRPAGRHASVGQIPGDRRKRGGHAEAARIAVHEYCLLNYGTGYAGGTPRRLLLARKELWIVPVVLTSPGYGAVGEVGMVAVDVASGAVVGATPRPEVRTAGTRLALEKRHELDAAFHRARTV